jgi:hypothetical protein
MTTPDPKAGPVEVRGGSVRDLVAEVLPFQERDSVLERVTEMETRNFAAPVSLLEKEPGTLLAGLFLDRPRCSAQVPPSFYAGKRSQ